MKLLREDACIASAFAIVGTALIFLAAEITPGHNPAPPAWTSIIAVLAAAIGQTFRRIQPIVALSVVVLTLSWSLIISGSAPLGVALVLADTLYAAVLFSSRRTGWAVAAAAGLVMISIVLDAVVTDGWRAGLYLVFNLGLLLALPVFWALEVRNHRERANAERERSEALARVAELNRAAAIAAERNRMARDLHDVVAGQLSAIALQSEAALTLSDDDPALLHKVLAEVRRGTLTSLAEMRTMIDLLRSDDPDEPLTAPAGLDRLDLLLETAGAAGLHVELHDRRVTAQASVAVEIAAYRIVQEALTNAAKHAAGSRVRCTLDEEDGALHLEVVNDLVPDASRGVGTRNGLLGAAERAASVGGRLNAGEDGGVWAVRARLPLAEAVQT